MNSLGAVSFQQNVFLKHNQDEKVVRDTPHLAESDQESKSTCSQRLDQILESFLNVKAD